MLEVGQSISAKVSPELSTGEYIPSLKKKKLLLSFGINVNPSFSLQLAFMMSVQFLFNEIYAW